MPPRTDSTDNYFSSRKIRCALAHDHGLLRQGLRRLLEDEPDIEVVSEADNAAECLRKVHEYRPDVVIADATTFGLPAAEARLCVARESGSTKLVFLSVEQQTSAEELVEMVRRAYSSSRTSYLEAPPERDPRLPTTTLFPQERVLTTREREVLKLLAEGKTVRASATILGLSVKTVDAHKFNLMRKLGIHNKAELVMWAIQKKVVKIPVNF
ncbi:MAG: response regulator transcription factor [Candidatus Sulfotelmatobacter sp.]